MPTGGGTAGDGGVPWTWATVSVTGATSSSGIVGIGATSSELWGVQGDGRVYRAMTGGFTALFVLQSGANDLFVSAARMVISQPRALRTCNRMNMNCTVANEWETFDLVTPNNDFSAGVCGRSGTDIYALTTNTSDTGGLYHYDGADWTALDRTLALKSPRACWFEGAVLWIAGEDGVLRYDAGAGSFERITGGPGIAPVQFFGGVAIGGVVYAVGQEGLVARRVGGTWSIVNGPVSLTGPLRAIGGPTADELWAVGGTFSAGLSGYEWHGSSWAAQTAPMSGFGSQSSVNRVFMRTANELYFAGHSATAPVVLRATR